MLLLLMLSIVNATIIHVPQDQSTIQAGIDAAVEGDTVLVQPGTYVENINFDGKNIIVGSLTVTTGDTSYISQTVIDGDSSGSVVTFENGEGSTAVLSGFKLTNGNGTSADLLVGGHFYLYGGGIYCTSSSPSLSNLKISGNSATGGSYPGGGGMSFDNSSPSLTNVTITDNSASYGGGILCSGNSSPSLSNVTLSGNTGGYGGGIYVRYSSPSLSNVTITDNSVGGGEGGGIYFSNDNSSLVNVTISGNTAWKGGGMSSQSSNASLVDVIFSGNVGSNYGGGIYIDWFSSPNLLRVTVVGNSSLFGGGIYISRYSNPTLSQVIIRDNWTTGTVGDGGGILIGGGSNASLSNVTITGNTTSDDGGGMYCAGSSPSLTNVTIANNSASSNGGGMYCSSSSPTLTNVTITDNSASSNGGGISCVSNSSPSFSRLTIHGNTANSGGGIYFSSSSPTFNTGNRSNIYRNYAIDRFGNDLANYSPTTIAVVVDTFTVMYPSDYYAYPVDNFTFDILNAKVEQVDSDLYVSPDGDDTNSGVSLTEPLRTISFALNKILADSLNPHTIYLSDGVYSPSSSGELFPLYMASYVSLYGESEDGVILDADSLNGVMVFDQVQNITIANLTITGGAAYSGGAIDCRGSSPELVNLTITENSATRGGGVSCYNSSMNLESVTITNNSASYGGGMYYSNSSPNFSNVTINGNTSYYSGGGIYCRENSNPILVNTILWNNSPQEIYFYEYYNPNSITIAYSDILNGQDSIVTNDNGTINWMDGNIDANPLFVDAENGDFRLQEDSPCIDAGTPFFIWEGDTLINIRTYEYFGSAPDMGALEKVPNVITVYPGDTDNNGFVNALDVLPIGIYFLQQGNPRDAIMVSWLPAQASTWEIWASTYADANGDGVVDEKDVIAIGVNWGNTHNNTLASFAIDPNDSALLQQHMDAFQRIYNSLSGESEAVESMKTLLKSILGIQRPDVFSLDQNYPNPFNPRTTIRFGLPEAQTVTLTVYNIRGQEVVILADKKMYDAGPHTVEFDAKKLGNGVYFYHFEAGRWGATRKMVVVK